MLPGRGIINGAVRLCRNILRLTHDIGEAVLRSNTWYAD